MDAQAVYGILVAFALSVFRAIQGCSVPDNYQPWTMPRKISYTNIVIQAEVKTTYLDPRFDYGEGTRSYYAEVDVMCVFKGDTGKIPAVLNITEAGEVPGKCTTITLTPQKSYILYLYEDRPGIYVHQDFTPTEADDNAMATLQSFCGIKSEKIDGAVSSYECPEVKSQSNCEDLPANAYMDAPGDKTKGSKADGKAAGIQTGDRGAEGTDPEPPADGAAENIPAIFYSALTLVVSLCLVSR